MPLGPTTPHHNGTIRLTGDMDILSLHQAAWLQTRPQRIEAKRLAVPRRRGAHGRAADLGPAHLVQRALQIRPIALAVAQKNHLGPLGDELADELDDLHVEGLRTMPFGTLTHAPREGQGAPLIDHVEHERQAPPADDTAIHDEHHRLQGEMTQQDVRRRQKVHLLQDMGVVEPSRKAFDAAFRFGAIGYFRRDVRQLGALAAHDAADERRQGGQVPGDCA
jgi:hypothetical protein